MHNVNRFRGRIPKCHCRCILCRLNSLISRFRLFWLRGPPLVRRWGPGDGPAGCPYHFTSYSGQLFANGNPAFGLQLHHPVGSPIVPFNNVLGGSAWRGTGDGSCCLPATGRGHYVVQSSDTVPVRHIVSPHVVRNDGPRHRTDGVSSG